MQPTDPSGNAGRDRDTGESRDGNAHSDHKEGDTADRHRNDSALRKDRDMPDDAGKSKRDPEKDYGGAAKKDH